MPGTTEELLPLVYGELRKLAASRMHREAPGHPLQPGAPVREVFIDTSTFQKNQQNSLKKDLSHRATIPGWFCVQVRLEKYRLSKWVGWGLVGR